MMKSTQPNNVLYRVDIVHSMDDAAVRRSKKRTLLTLLKGSYQTSERHDPPHNVEFTLYLSLLPSSSHPFTEDSRCLRL